VQQIYYWYFKRKLQHLVGLTNELSFDRGVRYKHWTAGCYY